MKNALPCIACGRELRNVSDDSDTNQPYCGTAFVSHGHYGSTIFDPMNGHYLELNVCDLCLALHYERIMIGRDSKPIIEDGAVVGAEPVQWRLVPWHPTRNTLNHVTVTALEHFQLYDDELANEDYNKD